MSTLTPINESQARELLALIAERDRSGTAQLGGLYDKPVSRRELENTLSSVQAERDRLKALNAQMVELLQESQKMRPMLLRDYGAVPECVLAYCNLARAMLAKQP